MLPILLLLQSSPAGSATGNPLQMMLPVVVMLGIFYFLLFLPMKRQRKRQQEMLRGLQNGQIVLTSGGIIGTITELKEDDTLVLRVKPDGIKLQIARTAVSSLLTGEAAKK